MEDKYKMNIKLSGEMVITDPGKTPRKIVTISIDEEDVPNLIKWINKFTIYDAYIKTIENE